MEVAEEAKEIGCRGILNMLILVLPITTIGVAVDSEESEEYNN